jgi:hypothetical protein
MPRRRVYWFVGLFSLLALGARAETLPLAQNLVDLKTAQGEQFFKESAALEAYFPLSINFVTQKTQAYCGVASIVMVLNALEVPAPSTPEYEPYHTFTQDNLLDTRTEQILPRDVLAKIGMTLDQIGSILALQPVNVEVHHAMDGGLADFRATASRYLAQKDHFVLINYMRKAIGQERGGHISPLAAYDSKTDRFLVLDVARYKYPPVWVTASDLFDAMNTTDADNGNKTRGYVLIAK